LKQTKKKYRVVQQRATMLSCSKIQMGVLENIRGRWQGQRTSVDPSVMATGVILLGFEAVLGGFVVACIGWSVSILSLKLHKKGDKSSRREAFAETDFSKLIKDAPNRPQVHKNAQDMDTRPTLRKRGCGARSQREKNNLTFTA
jgi:hypothetical protein